MSDWISIKDRLPEATGKYQVKMRVGSMAPKVRETTCYFKNSEHFPRFLSGDWRTVTHWKPPTEERLTTDEGGEGWS